MIGEYNLLFVRSLFNLHLDLFLLLTHPRDVFIHVAYDFCLFILDRLSMDRYRRTHSLITTWLALVASLLL